MDKHVFHRFFNPWHLNASWVTRQAKYYVWRVPRYLDREDIDYIINVAEASEQEHLDRHRIDRIRKVLALIDAGVSDWSNVAKLTGISRSILQHNWLQLYWRCRQFQYMAQLEKWKWI